MFGFAKNIKKCDIYAPVQGRCIPIECVKDNVFAKKLLGDGTAFHFEGDTVYAPCDGKVIMLPASKHAIGLEAVNGLQLLLHIGLNTVHLNGEGFQLLVQLNQKVKHGDPLLKLDRSYMNEKQMDLTTPMIMTNSEQYEYELIVAEEVTPHTQVIHAIRK